MVTTMESRATRAPRTTTPSAVAATVAELQAARRVWRLVSLLVLLRLLVPTELPCSSLLAGTRRRSRRTSEAAPSCPTRKCDRPAVAPRSWVARCLAGTSPDTAGWRVTRATARAAGGAEARTRLGPPTSRRQSPPRTRSAGTKCHVYDRHLPCLFSL